MTSTSSSACRGPRSKRSGRRRSQDDVGVGDGARGQLEHEPRAAAAGVLGTHRAAVLLGRLAIVRQVAESHAGTVTAEAAPDGGSLFRLRLPVTAVGEAEPAGSATGPKREATRSPTARADGGP